MKSSLARFRLVGIAAILALLAGIARPSQTQAVDISLDRDDQVINQSVRVRPGTYRIADSAGDGAIHVQRDGIVLDFQGATLVGAPDTVRPDRYRGIGIRIRGARRVVVKNAVIRGFNVAIQAIDCERLEIVGCDTSRNFRQYLSSTPAAEVAGDWLWPHENDAGEWETRYGAGISLLRCADASIHGNRGHDGQNGILLSRSTGCRIYDNDFSFNSGWGLALWRSSKNVISRNKFDWCVRGYSHGVYDRGQDSTGILIFEQSNENVFAYNSATHGGDGFFLYAGHETTKQTGAGGCNDNLVFRNDFSYAVANGIEATFSLRNRFLDNKLVGCNYGVWAGYSSETLIAGNFVKDSRIAGVAIEHGQLNEIIDNSFAANPIAIKLWWDEDPQFLESEYGKRRNTGSEDYTIEHNRFVGDRVVVELRDTDRVGIANNAITGCPTVLDLAGENAGVVLQDNDVKFRAAASGRTASSDAPVCLVRNRTAIEQVVGPNAYDVPIATLRESVEGPARIAAAHASLERTPPPTRPTMPRVPGVAKPFLAPGVPHGRDRMFVDEWGPFDPRLVRLTPTTLSGSNRATVYLIGRSAPFRVTNIRGDVTVSPSAGTVPATLTISRAADERQASASETTFAVEVEVEGRTLACRGTLWNMTWETQFYAWKRADGEPAKAPPGGAEPQRQAAAWKTITAARPIRTVTGDAVAFDWRSGGPLEDAAVQRDYFATVSTTTVTLAKGVYEIRTRSDDGVRVFVDDRKVIDNWTWHAPTLDRARVELGGAHRIRVEHFEIDGHATLSLDLRRVRATQTGAATSK